MARASPSWAMTPNSLACAFDSAAADATRAIVVFSPAPPFTVGTRAAGGRDGGKPYPPNSPFSSNGPAQKCGPLPTMTVPQAFTAARAPTVWPRRVTADAEPRPPFRLTVVAPNPAPEVPSAKVPPAADAAA